MKGKVLLGLGLALVLLASSMSACAPKPAEKVTLTALSSWKTNHFITDQFVKLVEDFNTRAAGKLEIQLKGGPEIIKASDQLAAVGDGSIDMIVSYVGYHSGVVPEGGIIGLPVVTWDSNNISKLSHAVRDEMNKAYASKAKAMYVIDFAPNLMNVFTSKKKITKVDDMKGLKLRTTGGWDEKALAALGAAPTKIPSEEIYTSAQTGIIDGGSRPVASIPDWREQEVWKYMVNTPLQYSVTASVFVNVNKLNALPADLKKLFLDIFAEWEPKVNKHYYELDQKMLKDFPGMGIQLVDLDTGEEAKWRSTLANAAEDYFVKLSPTYGKTLIDQLKSAK